MSNYEAAVKRIIDSAGEKEQHRTPLVRSGEDKRRIPESAWEQMRHRPYTKEDRHGR